MKILIVSSSFFPKIDGSTRCVYDHARKLSQRGHDVYLTTRGINDTPRFENIEGIKVIRSAFAYRRTSMIRRFTLILEQMITIMMLQRRLKFEVIHVHGYTAGLSALPTKIRYRVPLVITTHGTELLWPRRLRWKSSAEVKLTLFFEKLVLNLSDVIVVQSPGVYNYMLKIYGNNIWRKVRPIHTGVDHIKFSPMVSSTQNQILFVGALSEIKGVSKLIKSFARVHQEVPDSKLLLVGLGPNKPFYERLVSSLNLDGSVQFLGNITDDQVLRNLYRDSDIVVLPSLVGGPVSCTILEGLSSGRAVISTNVPGGIPDVLSDGVGVLLPSADENQLAESMIRLLKDREYLHSIQMKARQAVEQRYTLESMIEKLEGLYSSMGN
jgi:glycosyltransferase involved in cell wall biosynthesis